MIAVEVQPLLHLLHRLTLSWLIVVSDMIAYSAHQSYE